MSSPPPPPPYVVRKLVLQNALKPRNQVIPPVQAVGHGLDDEESDNGSSSQSLPNQASRSSASGPGGRSAPVSHSGASLQPTPSHGGGATAGPASSVGVTSVHSKLSDTSTSGVIHMAHELSRLQIDFADDSTDPVAELKVRLRRLKNNGQANAAKAAEEPRALLEKLEELKGLQKTADLQKESVRLQTANETLTQEISQLRKQLEDSSALKEANANLVAEKKRLEGEIQDLKETDEQNRILTAANDKLNKQVAICVDRIKGDVTKYKTLDVSHSALHAEILRRNAIARQAGVNPYEGVE